MPPKKYVHGQHQAKLAAARAWQQWIAERTQRLIWMTDRLNRFNLTDEERDNLEFEQLMLQGTIATAKRIGARELRK